ncbi:MAG: methyltransferase domain-containing protein [Pseudomonadota bacterium]
MSGETEHIDEYGVGVVTMLELIWGEGFLAPGGAETVRRIVGGRDLTDKLVLDIGCGIGGGDLVLAGALGARVVGVDLEAPLLARARANAEKAGLSDRVEFRQVSVGPIDAADGTYDLVYSSGAFTQTAEKAVMFAEVHRVLKPGGAFTVYDWMRGPEPYSDDMQYWFELEGLTYAMETLEAHERLLAEAGFTDIQVEDDGGWYARECAAELERMKGPLRAAIVDALGQKDYEHYLENWRVMALVLQKGELRPGYFRGVKGG